jgi:magnesium-transporting ATPase (P-type)
MAGKVRFIAFDKTGTLTEDRLDVAGVHQVVNSGKGNGVKFGTYTHDIEIVNKQFMAALSCCHELSMVDNKPVGDPLDQVIFDWTHASFTERSSEQSFDVHWLTTSTNDAGGHIIVRQRFEFQSSLQDMAVIGEDTEGKDHVVFVKGAPEVIASKCDATSLPSDFTTVLSSYTKKGLRVIAYAYRRISDGLPLQGEASRSDYRLRITQKLHFLGFAVLCNPIKPETAPTLKVSFCPVH